MPHLHEQCLGFHLHGQVPDIATGASHMPSCPDQLRQHVVVLYPAGVGGGAGITHQHGPRGQVSQCLPTRLLNADRALHTEPDVAVGVYQTGDDEGVPGQRAGPSDGFTGELALDDPEVAGLLLRQEGAMDVHRLGSHAGKHRDSARRERLHHPHGPRSRGPLGGQPS